MAISTFSFFLPLPFFAAAGGFGGAAAFGAFGAFGAFWVARRHRRRPTRARCCCAHRWPRRLERADMIALLLSLRAVHLVQLRLCRTASIARAACGDRCRSCCSLSTARSLVAA